MTTLSDFDRLLGSVLDSDGPQAVPPGLVDAALTQARSVQQRRPLIRVIDWEAWPPLGLPLTRASARRLAIIALLALLAVAAIASALLIGSERPPRLLGDGDRIYVWSDGTAHLVTSAGADAHTTPEGRLGSGCPTLVGGTTVVGQFGFGGWDFTELTTGRLVASVGADYAGFERWSPDARRLALVDFGGRVGIVSFEDPTKPATRWFEVPGVVASDWSLDGGRLATVAKTGPLLTVAVIDVASGIVTTVVSTRPLPDSPNGPARSLLWSSRGSTVAFLVAALTTSGTRSMLTFLDLETGAVVTLPDLTGTDETSMGVGAWSADGEWFAVPTSPSTITIFDRLGGTATSIPTQGSIADLAWSADGKALAFREGDQLVVADRAGHRNPSVSLGPSAAFGWDRSAFALLVARRTATGVVVERYRGDDLELVAQATSTIAGPASSSASSPTSFDPAQRTQICLHLDGATAPP